MRETKGQCNSKPKPAVYVSLNLMKMKYENFNNIETERKSYRTSKLVMSAFGAIKKDTFV